jgi:hypothetical protein
VTARFPLARGHRSAEPDAGTDRGQGRGTVLAWNRRHGQGVLRVTDAAHESPVDVVVAAPALDPATGGALQVGQAVDARWERRGREAHAVLVRPCADLPAAPGA